MSWPRAMTNQQYWYMSVRILKIIIPESLIKYLLEMTTLNWTWQMKVQSNNWWPLHIIHTDWFNKNKNYLIDHRPNMQQRKRTIRLRSKSKRSLTKRTQRQMERDCIAPGANSDLHMLPRTTNKAIMLKKSSSSLALRKYRICRVLLKSNSECIKLFQL